MEFFEKMGDAISETGRDITQKVTDLTELTKLHMDTRRQEDAVRRLYRELGKQYYELHKDDEEPVFEEVELITETLERLQELKKAAAKCKGKKVCPECGAPNADDAVFCNKCGAKCEDEVPEEADAEDCKEAEIVAETEDAPAEVKVEVDAEVEEEADAEVKVEVDVEKKESDI